VRTSAAGWGRGLLAVLLAAAVLRTLPWWSPNAFFGVLEYDDGVYYAAARLLLGGELPYREFVIVHSPVTSLALLPSAAVGSVLGDPAGMASARVLILLVALANTCLVHRLALRLPLPPERSRAAALVAAAFYAFMPNTVMAEHTVLLEPPVTLACLLGTLALTRAGRPSSRAAFAAGVAYAGGLGVKVFAAAYVVAGALWVWQRAGARRLLGFAAGLATGFVVLVLPLVVAAPSAAWHDVVVTQLSRPENTGVDQGVSRFASMLGLGYLTGVPGALVAAGLLAGAAAGVAARGPVRQHVAWFWAVSLAPSVVAIQTAPTFFLHYGAFLAPGLAMMTALCLFGPGDRLRWLRGAVALGVVVAFVLGTGSDLLDRRSQADLEDVARQVPAGSCVYYDAVSLAVAADVFTAPSESCPGWIDGRGVALTQNADWPRGQDFYPEGFVADARWQAETVAQMRYADFLLLRSSPADFPEWTPATRAFVLARFDLAWRSEPGDVHVELWRRRAS